MPADRYRSRLFTPPARPLAPLRGLMTMARNPVDWWPARLYEEGIHSTRLRGRTFAHVALPDLARTVLLDEEGSFVRSFILRHMLAPGMGEGLLTSDGARWRHQRKLVAPAFGHGATDACQPLFDAHAIRCAARVRGLDGRTVAMLPQTTLTTLGIILETMFGDTDIALPTLARDIETYLFSLGRPDPLEILGAPAFVPRPWRRRGLAAVVRLRALCRRVLEIKRVAGSPDGSLAGRLLDALDPDTGKGLEDEAIVDNLMAFIGAGHETTSLALCWTLYLLAAQPALQQRLREEARSALGDGPIDDAALQRLDLHRRVLDESMRLYPPLSALVRSVARPLTLGGLELVPGDHVTVAVLPLHRNAALWPDPDAFDAERFRVEAIRTRDRFAYLPFGSGPRVCVASGFARAEATTVLARLLLACRFGPADGPPPKPVLRVTLRPTNGLPLKVSAVRDTA